jgi:hypothetical protein
VRKADREFDPLRKRAADRAVEVAADAKRGERA